MSCAPKWNEISSKQSTNVMPTLGISNFNIILCRETDSFKQSRFPSLFSAFSLLCNVNTYVIFKTNGDKNLSTALYCAMQSTFWNPNGMKSKWRNKNKKKRKTNGEKNGNQNKENDKQWITNWSVENLLWFKRRGILFSCSRVPFCRFVFQMYVILSLNWMNEEKKSRKYVTAKIVWWKTCDLPKINRSDWSTISPSRALCLSLHLTELFIIQFLSRLAVK